MEPLERHNEICETSRLQTRPKAASYLSVGDSIEGLKAQFGEAEGASQVELIEVLIDQTEFQPNRTLCPLLIV